MIKLSERLSAIAACVPAGRSLADVGTDHGFLPIYLVKKGIAPRAVAMDVRKGPLERAQAHIREEGLEERIETRLSDGLAALAPGEAEVIVLAGMGGKLILRILENDREKALLAKKLVLSPQSELPEFRRGLESLGFFISREQILKDEGKYYAVMEAEPGDRPCGREIFYLFGKDPVEEKSPVLLEYLDQQERFCEETLSSLSGNKSGRAEERRQEIITYRERIREAKHEMQ